MKTFMQKGKKWPFSSRALLNNSANILLFMCLITVPLLHETSTPFSPEPQWQWRTRWYDWPQHLRWKPASTRVCFPLWTGFPASPMKEVHKKSSTNWRESKLTAAELNWDLWPAVLTSQRCVAGWPLNFCSWMTEQAAASPPCHLWSLAPATPPSSFLFLHIHFPLPAPDAE